MKNTTSKFKLLLVSPVIPPSPTGQGIIINRLLQNWSINQYCLLATEASTIENHRAKNTNKYYLTKQVKKKDTLSIVNKVTSKIKKILAIPFRFTKLVQTLLHIIKNEQISTVICCSGDYLALPACALVCKIANKPFFIYFFDDYINQWPSKLFRKLASIIEKKCVKESKTIVTPNEFLAIAYENRYGRKPVIIHNGLDINTVMGSPRILSLNNDAPIKIVYTGSIYYAHYDAFLSLIAYMNNTATHIELHIYTSQDTAQLKKLGITNSHVYYHPYLQQDAVSKTLKTADLLFLPLSFENKYKEVINTSAPGKMAEYLASGTPILVHAPRDSFVSWYSRTYDCALTVDEQSLSAFEKMLMLYQTDANYINKMTQNALNQAHSDFAHSSVEKKFKAIFELTK